MDPFENEHLSKIFYKNRKNADFIGSRESTNLEFKESFNFSNLGVYAKTMAAFGNKDGGYIVFGVKDNPRKLIGINRPVFDSLDQAKLSEGLNSLFQPAIEWEVTIWDWNKLSFGLIYVHKAIQKPIIAVKNETDVIKEGEIYYRYRGRSEKIRYPELRQILTEQIEANNEAWRRIIERSVKIDPVNVAVMDTISGEIAGKGGMIVLDEALIPKLKFIRDGDFTQKQGAPTLKLIGDLRSVPVSAVKKQKVVIGTDIYQYRAKQVASQVQDRIGKKFDIALHIKAWKKYRPRPANKQLGFKSEYSEFKQAENDYRYSDAWITFLVDKLKTDKEYESLRNVVLQKV